MRLMDRMRSRGVASGTLGVALAMTVAMGLALVEACGGRTALDFGSRAEAEAGAAELDAATADAALPALDGRCRPVDPRPTDPTFCGLQDAKVPCVPARWELCPRRLGPGECVRCASHTEDAGYADAVEGDGGR